MELTNVGQKFLLPFTIPGKPLLTQYFMAAAAVSQRVVNNL